MNSIRFSIAAALVALLLVAGPAAAESDAIKTIAGIMINLNHFPSEEDKAVLKEIIDSDESSEEAATIAMALSNMQHQVTEADAERLADLVDDDMNDASARELAGILLGINHSPSEEDKAALQAITGE